MRAADAFTVFDVARTLCGKDSDLACQWDKQRRDALDQGRLDLVIAALKKHADRCEEAARNVTCLAEQSRAHGLRARGMCVSTGVVEGACTSGIGDRLENGGMRWAVSPCDAPFTAIVSTTCWQRRAA